MACLTALPASELVRYFSTSPEGPRSDFLAAGRASPFVRCPSSAVTSSVELLLPESFTVPYCSLSLYHEKVPRGREASTCQRYLPVTRATSPGYYVESSVHSGRPFAERFAREGIGGHQRSRWSLAPSPSLSSTVSGGTEPSHSSSSVRLSSTLPSTTITSSSLATCSKVSNCPSESSVPVYKSTQESVLLPLSPSCYLAESPFLGSSLFDLETIADVEKSLKTKVKREECLALKARDLGGRNCEPSDKSSHDSSSKKESHERKEGERKGSKDSESRNRNGGDRSDRGDGRKKDRNKEEGRRSEGGGGGDDEGDRDKKHNDRDRGGKDHKTQKKEKNSKKDRSRSRERSKKLSEDKAKEGGDEDNRKKMKDGTKEAKDSNHVHHHHHKEKGSKVLSEKKEQRTHDRRGRDRSLSRSEPRPSSSSSSSSTHKKIDSRHSYHRSRRHRRKNKEGTKKDKKRKHSSTRSSSKSSGAGSSTTKRRHRRGSLSRSVSTSPATKKPKNTTDPTKNSEFDPFPPDLQGPCFFKVLPKSRDPPVILGMDNRGVINLAKKHGCKLKLSSCEDFFPETDRRLLLVYGAEIDTCVEALYEWVQTISEKTGKSSSGAGEKNNKNVSSSSGESGGVTGEGEVTFIVAQDALELRIKDREKGEGKEEKIVERKLGHLRRMNGGDVRVRLSSRTEMKKARARERLFTLKGPLEQLKSCMKSTVETLQSYEHQRDYMNIKYLEFNEVRKRRKRSLSPLPTIPKIVIPEPSMPSAMVPGLQFHRALQNVNVQDELIKMTNLRGIIDEHDVKMRGPAYIKVIISDLVTTLLLGTRKDQKSTCPLRTIEAECGVLAKIQDPETPGILERLLIVSGEPREADKATMMILEKVYAACIMAGQPSQVTWRMCVSNSAAALIIGTGGHRVRQLRTVSNTRIQINTRDGVPFADRWERVITVTGQFDAVVRATKAMLPFMHADSNHSHHIHQCFGTGTKIEMPDWVEAVVQRDGMDEEACKKPPLPDNRTVNLSAGPCFLKLLIDNGSANALIGENSSNIERLSEQTKCAMKFADPTNIFPGCQGERILMLSGTAEALNAASIAIIEKCKEVHPNLSYDQMYGKLVVPHTCCAAIVGPGGHRVREIREATITRVGVSRKGVLTNERLVTIFGMPQGVHTALITICGIIQCDASLRTLLEIVYPAEALEQQRKLEEERLSAHMIGAVMEGVSAVVSKVASGTADETAQIALRRLQEMQRTAAIAAGELPPDDHYGSSRGDRGSDSKYSAPMSFVPASTNATSGTLLFGQAGGVVSGMPPGGGMGGLSQMGLPGQQALPPSPPPGMPMPSSVELGSSGQLSRQAMRQKILDASLNRARTAAEALSGGGSLTNNMDDDDFEEDPSLAGLMDEKF
ncbi:rna-binding protein nova-1 [Cystoisospora suis]|uniref:Rna-binding protein nova-1 n=1 Tax=Cystoisospora suis TaxID=483139 RepID=A0A2C6KH18_9APIC|nr:rna-binding protein nova-1 [Cystoisospora suis]